MTDKWTDERIAQAMSGNAYGAPSVNQVMRESYDGDFASVVDMEDAIDVAKEIRDDIRAEADDVMVGQIKSMRTEIAALRQQLQEATAYVPVEDGTELAVWEMGYATDFETITVVPDGLNLMLYANDEADTIPTFLRLPDDIRLCRRQPAAQDTPASLNKMLVVTPELEASLERVTDWVIHITTEGPMPNHNGLIAARLIKEALMSMDAAQDTPAVASVLDDEIRTLIHKLLEDADYVASCVDDGYSPQLRRIRRAKAWLAAQPAAQPAAQGQAGMPSEVYVISEWLDGKTVLPILVCLNEADATAELNAFKDVVKVPLKLNTPAAQGEGE